MSCQTTRAERWTRRLADARAQLPAPEPVIEGRLTRIVGLTLEARGFPAAVGSRCRVMASPDRSIEAEVVGFADDRSYLMPLADARGLLPGARVRPLHTALEVPVGNSLLGRVVDASGKPIDGLGPLDTGSRRSLNAAPINPLSRLARYTPLDVGVRSINALLGVARGQRLGLLAGSGVGKSALLAMMTRNTDADVTVVALIGERGREVAEFVGETLGPEGLRRSVVVAVPADQSPLQRLHGAMCATSIAEQFRDQGKDVLLLVDSLTRYAQAQREIGLAVGEPPATRGYPPSAFTRLPQLIERAGQVRGGGSITAFYTVLAEGDDQNDPIVDAARAVLDGHVVLSRSLAESGHYPAVDIEASVSRLMSQVASDEHQQLAQRFRRLYSHYRGNEDLIKLGVYQKGSDPETDEAIQAWPLMQRFLRQAPGERVSVSESIAQLRRIMQGALPADESGLEPDLRQSGA